MHNFKSVIPTALKHAIKRSLCFLRWDKWQNISWAQEGEDLILNRFLNSKQSGFYVDIGAHHPKRFSNTYFYYRKGWKGINIDAMPGSMAAFEKMRPRDINLECGIGEKNEKLPYYIFNDHALNGFSKQLSDERRSEGVYKLISENVVEIRTLSSVLDQFENEFEGIDFLTIDVEGFDLEVLKSNDWEKYRPEYILAEILSQNNFVQPEQPILKFLENQDYKLVAKSMNTAFFQTTRVN